MKERIDWFRQQFIGCSVDITHDVNEAIEWLKTKQYDNVFLDHDLEEKHYASWNIRDDATTGYAVVKWLIKNTAQREAKFIIHSLNPAGSEKMFFALRDAGYKVQKVSYLDLKKRMRYYAS